MAEYIDRDTLRERMAGFVPPFIDESNQAYVDGLTDAYTLICQAPTADVVERTQKNSVNLCDSCRYDYPECPSGADDVLYGNGIGNDNICCCNKYCADVVNRKTCKNLATEYDDCDQFVCSQCGIELQDWRRVERDEDGLEVYHEYRLRLCPSCGAKIEGGDDDV